MRIIVTGGAGYIGSHTCLELLAAGHEIAVIDNLSNSKEESLRRAQEITGKRLAFHRVDLLDREGLRDVFRRFPCEAVLHFAGLKAVGESVSQPLRYFQNNVTGALLLCQVMQECGVRKLVFSSSATVYGDPSKVPITEDFPLSATNPYGRTKLMIEEILRDLPGPILPGTSPSSATSTPWVPTPADASARTPTESPTISSRTSPRWLGANCRSSSSSAKTIRRPTVPGSATTSM